MRKVDFTARYARDFNHWLRPDGDLYLLGLTDWAQYTIGNILQLVDLPTFGQLIQSEQCYMSVESNKSTTELIFPLPAKVIAINEKIFIQPALINQHCYGEGWLLKIALLDKKDWLHLESGDWYKNEIDKLFRK